MKKLKIGIIGCGGIANSKHLPSLAKLADKVELTAFCDIALERYEANIFGPWDPDTYEVEDSAFGFVKMENGATIYIESSWALNMLGGKEAQVTLCGTDAGAEMFGDAYAGTGFVRINSTKYNQFIETQTEPGKAGAAAGAGGADTYWGKVGVAEAEHWIDAILNDSEPVVKPEQAFVITQILEAVYKSAETGQAIELLPISV
nr:Gfo/Idh/MocA family oxidoreductase [Paenibacillus beijingensis]